MCLCIIICSSVFLLTWNLLFFFTISSFLLKDKIHTFLRAKIKKTRVIFKEHHCFYSLPSLSLLPWKYIWSMQCLCLCVSCDLLPFLRIFDTSRFNTLRNKLFSLFLFYIFSFYRIIEEVHLVSKVSIFHTSRIDVFYPGSSFKTLMSIIHPWVGLCGHRNHTTPRFSFLPQQALWNHEL